MICSRLPLCQLLNLSKKNLDVKSSKHPKGCISKQKKWEKFNYLGRNSGNNFAYPHCISHALKNVTVSIDIVCKLGQKKFFELKN